MIVFFRKGRLFNAGLEDQLKKVLSDIAKDHFMKIEYLNIIFNTDEELLKINVKYLQHNYYTDIISFNYSKSPGIIEGELYISKDRIKENAKNFGVSKEAEASRVII